MLYEFFVYIITFKSFGAYNIWEVKIMFNSNCGYRMDCPIISVLASIIIGIITAFLTFSATITVTPAFLWVVFGIAIVYLAIVLFKSLGGSGIRGCICNILPIFLAGILGTILLSVILLGITFAATSVIGAIVTGALLLFFSLIITSTACLIKCLTGCDE